MVKYRNRNIGGLIMNKYLLGILICLAGIPVFGLDLDEYPGAVNRGSILINVGVGYGTMINKGYKTLIPPVMVSADYALPIGKLPFSFGLMAGFSGEFVKKTDVQVNDKDGQPISQDGSGEFTNYIFGAGGRFSYHFNWGVNKLDTYATLTLGFLLNSLNYQLETPGQKNSDSDSEFLPLWGLNIGGRYFFTSHFGLFLDVGYTNLTIVSLGTTFKF
jgi:hypothetical protein